MEPRPGLLQVVRSQIRTRHLSYRTEVVYLHWIRRFIRFHGRRHPREMGAPEVEQFLTHLAVERKVSASTQNQALQAFLFLYRHVLAIELPWLENVTRARAACPRSRVGPRRCGIYLPRTCWPTATTSAPCRSCSATAM